MVATSSVSRISRSKRLPKRCLTILLGLSVTSVFISLTYSNRMLFISDPTDYYGDEPFHRAATALDYPQQSNSSKLVWLFSFPNSGFSYTLQNIAMASQKATATNYKPTMTNISRVVSRTSPWVANSTLPDAQHVLTYTRCNGYEIDDMPTFDFRDFRGNCRSVVLNETLSEKYSTDLISKAVHLFRNPTDIILSRMLQLSTRRSEPSEPKEQLIEWCSNVDNLFPVDWVSLMKKQKLDSDLSRDLPCRSEWLRIVQFHNNALKLRRYMNLSGHVVYFEDYEKDYAKAFDQLFDFLELSPVGEFLPFLRDANSEPHGRYFDESYMRMATSFVYEVATPECWKILKRYFEPWLKTEIAWLLSFPNSGTSYTIANVIKVTNATAGTNYPKEIVRNQHNASLQKVRPDVKNGPYLMRPETDVPPIVLTKTHCMAFCDSCSEREFVKNASQFEKGCAFVRTPDDKSVKYYDPSAISRAVHLFRNPFDNLVARKHLGVKIRGREGFRHENMTMMAQDSAEGLKAWCHFVDEEFWRYGRRFAYRGLTESTRQYFRKVPCASDVYRYVQWHNLAIEVTDHLAIPVHYVHYEDYESSETVDGIIDFLGLERKSSNAPFVRGKSYEKFFDPSHARAVATMIKKFASPTCWPHLRRYLEKWLEEPDASWTSESTNGPNYASQVQPSINMEGGNTTALADASSVRDGHSPEIVWLLSFPGAGESFVTRHTEAVSNASVAHNNAVQLEQPIAVRNDLLGGPFRRNSSLQVPRFLLTRSHCTGFCFDCDAAYLQSISNDEFEASCALCQQRVDGKFVSTSYAPHLPSKVVYLVRNPIDNIVVRNNELIQVKNKRGDPAIAHNSRQGQRMWCKVLDDIFWDNRDKLDTQVARLQDLIQAVPCGSSFYRYALWHNRATAMMERNRMSVHTLYYEDYPLDYMGTVRGLFGFLDLTMDASFEGNVGFGSYSLYFTEGEIRGIWKLLFEVSSQRTWSVLQRYYSSADVASDIPEVIWLLSFPNSGTSYTHTNTRALTGAAIATNYPITNSTNFENLEFGHLSPDLPFGPFMNKEDLKRKKPAHILTKSHCGSYCTGCGEDRSVTTEEDFAMECAMGHQTVGGFTMSTMYSLRVPRKAVHLVRNPFDNMVARMHLDAKLSNASGWSKVTKEGWSKDEVFEFRDTVEGRRAWCKWNDHMFIKNVTNPVLSESQRQVPCFSDLFRYTQWHNYAIAATSRLGIPLHVLHYEDYSLRFNETVEELMRFMGEPILHEPRTFHAGKNYIDLYTRDEILASIEFIRSVATPATWALLQRYFVNWIGHDTSGTASN